MAEKNCFQEWFKAIKTVGISKFQTVGPTW